MKKAEAIKWYKRISGGKGINRHKYLYVLKRGRIAKRAWDKAIFTLGIEYGAMMALIEIFNLTKEDLES